MKAQETLTTMGVDVGSGMVKLVCFDVPDGGAPSCRWKQAERIRRGDPIELAVELYESALKDLGLDETKLHYVATTGEGERVPYRTGHFYSMTTHARGAVHLVPGARAVVDLGALHGRAISVDERGKVLSYRMTSQCASGSGQFLENISRYLGITLDEVGDLSKQASAPEAPSGICAVLAETDVINMVSRQVPTPDILKGIHLSMAKRLAKLLKASGAEGTVLMTGGLSRDVGLLAALSEVLAEDAKVHFDVVTHPDAIFAGAIGAALWGAVRYRRLQKLDILPLAS